MPQVISGSACSCLVYFWAISLFTHLLSAAFSFLPLLLIAAITTTRPSNGPSTSNGRPSKRVADLTNKNLHAIPLTTAPHLHDINDVTAPRAGHARFSHVKHHDAGAVPVTCECTPKCPPECRKHSPRPQHCNPLVLGLSAGPLSGNHPFWAGKRRPAPRSTKNYQNHKNYKKKLKFQMTVAPRAFEYRGPYFGITHGIVLRTH
jgi:hypothetical protein